MPHALIVDDDTIASEALAELVADQGFTTACAVRCRQRATCSATRPTSILLDLVLPDGNGIELLREATTRDANTQVVVVTGHATLESSIEAMRHGATDYLLKPINLSQLRGVLSRVARPPDLSAEVKDLRTELRSLGHFGRLVGALAADAATLRSAEPRGTDGRDRVHHRRERHRQGNRRRRRSTRSADGGCGRSSR